MLPPGRGASPTALRRLIWFAILPRVSFINEPSLQPPPPPPLGCLEPPAALKVVGKGRD